MILNPEVVSKEKLLEMYEYLCDGRAFLAREVLEQILGIGGDDNAPTNA